MNKRELKWLNFGIPWKIHNGKVLRCFGQTNKIHISVIIISCVATCKTFIMKFAIKANLDSIMLYNCFHIKLFSFIVL